MAVVVLDGGMGQELIARSRGAPMPLWSARVLLEQPELVEEVHRDFLAAGAQIITLASYSATPTRLQRAGLAETFAALQKNAIAAAQRARDEHATPVRIAGCLPPLAGSYMPDQHLGKTRSLDEYRAITEIQCEAVDLFLCETLPSVQEIIWATRAAHETGLPVWTALTVDEHDGSRLRSGEPVEEGAAAALAEGAQAVLVNCSPPEATSTAVSLLAGCAQRVGAYANGFKSVLPLRQAKTVDCLETREDLGPASYAEFAQDWIRSGATIVGGCCEVGPAHIAAISETIRAQSPA